MAGMEEYERFRDFQTIDENDLKFTINYICANLNSQGCYYQYWYDLYSYTSKCNMVLQKRQFTKLGETVCEWEVVNFLRIQNIKSAAVDQFILMQFLSDLINFLYF